MRLYQFSRRFIADGSSGFESPVYVSQYWVHILLTTSSSDLHSGLPDCFTIASISLGVNIISVLYIIAPRVAYTAHCPSVCWRSTGFLTVLWGIRSIHFGIPRNNAFILCHLLGGRMMEVGRFIGYMIENSPSSAISSKTLSTVSQALDRKNSLIFSIRSPYS